MFQGVDERGQRVESAQLERAVDRHQDRLHLRAVLASVAQRVLPDDHRRPDLALRTIVVARDLRMIEKREQRVAIPPQALDQPPGVRGTFLLYDEGATFALD